MNPVPKEDEEAGAAEGEERDESGDEGSSLGEDVGDTPSWVHRGLQSAEAEQECLNRMEPERAQKEEQEWRIRERLLESFRAMHRSEKEFDARIKGLEREFENRG
mmetsp:Transcript_43852/g.64231  ORF Transcript_43852/g.64231 Transcript_43852/m.64231 type:complete len:105 (+) Transcript_43852:199-513(+)